MSTCCPNCPSSAAIGSEVASVCTECASASVAGASLSLSTAITMAVVAAAAIYTWRMARRALRRSGRVALA